MKKLLLALFCTISSLGVAQITATVSPDKACPNTTHDVTITVTNNQQSIPNGFTYTVTLNVKNDGGTVVKTVSVTSSTGFPIGTSKVYVIEDVPFTGPAVWTIDGSATVAVIGTFPLPPQNYTIEAPADVTILEPTLNNISTNSIPAGCTINFYRDGAFVTNSSDGNYTTSTPGDYTAKAMKYVYSTAQTLDIECVSANFSNTITIMATGIEDAQNVSVSVYPNPMASVVTMQSDLAAELSYDLTDSRGVVVQTGSFQGTRQLTTETLKAGTYVLSIKNQQEKVATYKLVK